MNGTVKVTKSHFHNHCNFQCQGLRAVIVTSKVSGNADAIVGVKLTVKVTIKNIRIIIVSEVVKAKNTLKGILPRKKCLNQDIEK